MLQEDEAVARGLTTGGSSNSSSNTGRLELVEVRKGAEGIRAGEVPCRPSLATF